MFEVPSFLSVTAGIVVFFAGKTINDRVAILRNFNIPEPVTGGLIAATMVFALHYFWGIDLSFDLGERDTLLVYFFTAIGLNARFSDLISGGRPLLVFLVLTLSYIVLQNLVGVSAAHLLDMQPQIGVLAGSASLIGGHGTVIAWAPDIKTLGINNALEIGVAAATLGLVIASLIGGPIAKFLLSRYRLQGEQTERVVGVGYEEETRNTINELDLMSVILTIHVAILIGWFSNEWISAHGFKLPLFVTCLLSGIVMSNTIPLLFKAVKWPARTPALAIVSDFSLALFLSMSLMSMQLWTIATLAGPLMVILCCQAIAAVFFIVFLLFPLMGRNYQAAVLSAGFGGFALGATPTAIANMTAVTKAHGAAPLAFLILPLVSAFFVDVTNSFVIKAALSWTF